MEVSSNWKKFIEVTKAETEENLTGGRDVESRRSGRRRHIKTKQNTHSRKLQDNDPQRQQVTRVLAMDCEMVGIQDGKENMLARVSIVNSHGHTLYDTFVKPREPVVDYRTHVSGVRRSDLVNGADFRDVQKAVADLLKGCILVGHALSNDLRVLFLSHPHRKIRDTSKYRPFRKISHGRTPSLKKLAYQLLGVKIQEGEHSSVEDAKAAMQLYNLHKKEWERALIPRVQSKGHE